MGCDAETDAVAALIAEYDADGNGTIDLEEFKEIYANTPFGTFNWSHVDHALLAKIEESAKGQHEDHAETSDFLRRMGKQGFHVQVSGDNDDGDGDDDSLKDLLKTCIVPGNQTSN
jgi:hypothetical protein